MWLQLPDDQWLNTEKLLTIAIAERWAKTYPVEIARPNQASVTEQTRACWFKYNPRQYVPEDAELEGYTVFGRIDTGIPQDNGTLDLISGSNVRFTYEPFTLYHAFTREEAIIARTVITYGGAVGGMAGDTRGDTGLPKTYVSAADIDGLGQFALRRAVVARSFGFTGDDHSPLIWKNLKLLRWALDNGMIDMPSIPKHLWPELRALEDPDAVKNQDPLRRFDFGSH